MGRPKGSKNRISASQDGEQPLSATGVADTPQEAAVDPLAARLRRSQGHVPEQKMRYSVFPARAVWDTRFGDGRHRLQCMRVLAALCCFTNPAGLSWVSQFYLAVILDLALPTVSKCMMELEMLGYVRDCGPYKGPRNSRYPTRVKQILFEERQPVPAPADYEMPLAANRLLQDSNYYKDSEVREDTNGLVGIIRHDVTETAVNALVQSFMWARPLARSIARMKDCTAVNALVQSFIRAIERASGLARDPAASRTPARVLALAGVTPATLEPIVFAHAKAALTAGRMPAANLGQLVEQILAETRKNTGSDA